MREFTHECRYGISRIVCYRSMLVYIHARMYVVCVYYCSFMSSIVASLIAVLYYRIIVMCLSYCYAVGLV